MDEKLVETMLLANRASLPLAASELMIWMPKRPASTRLRSTRLAPVTPWMLTAKRPLTTSLSTTAGASSVRRSRPLPAAVTVFPLMTTLVGRLEDAPRRSTPCPTEAAVLPSITRPSPSIGPSLTNAARPVPVPPLVPSAVTVLSEIVTPSSAPASTTARSYVVPAGSKVSPEIVTWSAPSRRTT